MSARTKFLIAGFLVLLAMACGGWVWFLAGKTLDDADKWSSVMAGIVGLTLGVGGLLTGMLALRQPMADHRASPPQPRSRNVEAGEDVGKNDHFGPQPTADNRYVDLERATVVQQQAQATYLAALTGDLDTWRGLDNPRRLSLEACFVQPTLRGPGRARCDADQVFRSVLPSQSTVREIRRGLSLEGVAGSGKTTLFKIWALRLRTDVCPVSDDGWLPVYLPLPFVERYCRDRGTWQVGIPQLAAARYPRPGGSASPEVADLVEQAMAVGRAVLLVDGMDEVSSDLRHRANTWLDDAGHAGHASTLMVSSRPGNSLAGVPFEVWRTEAFEPRQRDEMITRWFDGTTMDSLPLRDYLDQNPRFESDEMIANPLFLAMICTNYEIENRLPGSASEILDQYTQLMLERWDAERDVRRWGEGHPVVPSQLRQRVLEWIAHYFFESGYRTFEGTALTRQVADFLMKDHVDADATDLLTEIKEGSGLLIADRSGYWRFSHPVFQEYFTARYQALRMNEHSNKSWLRRERKRDPKGSPLVFFNEIQRRSICRD